eukprot:SAG31_NODE_378_length_16503_cov_28.830041_3_plen_65_part_00
MTKFSSPNFSLILPRMIKQQNCHVRILTHRGIAIFGHISTLQRNALKNSLYAHGVYLRRTIYRI